MNKGIFITFEGPEGAGKSTVLQQVVDRLHREGIDVVMTREPGGIEISESIREIILSPQNTSMDSRTEALLYAAARRQHLVEKVAPALEEGKIVLCDRFVDSSLAYQGYARGLGLENVWKINEFAIEGFMPQCTLYFDVEPSVGLQRIADSGIREVNRLDLESLAFHEKVREGYQLVKEQFPSRIHQIDASAALEDVVAAAMQVVKSQLSS